MSNFRSAKALGTATVFLFGAMFVADLLSILFGATLLFVNGWQYMINNDNWLHNLFQVVSLAGGLQMLCLFAVIVVFLIWLYRSVSNLDSLRAQNLEFSPGWAVGWWFVPFFSFVRPMQVVRELWNESDPDFEEDTVFSVKGGTPGIIAAWWAAFIVSRIVNNVSSSLMSSGGLKDPAIIPYFVMTAPIVEMIALALVIIVVRSIDRRQELRYERIMRNSTPSEPPPPQTFGFGAISNEDPTVLGESAASETPTPRDQVL